MFHQIRVDQKECIGCGLCANNLSNLFKIDEKDFKARLKKGDELVCEIVIDLSPKHLEQVKDLTLNCPTQAITLLEQ